jgi:predicted metal-dependent HD superfamily phosphohydrolase
VTWSYEDFVRRWRELCAALGLVNDIDKPLREIHDAYSEKHRAYHTLEHLGECLQLLEECRGPIPVHEYPLIELALWFHDGVYDVLSSRNEEKSADWALHWMTRWGRSAREKKLVRGLILITRHAATPASEAERWMCDIDLAILGAPKARYQAYEAQVRQEYKQVPWLLYRTKRGEILRAFLDRPALYLTPLLHGKLETQARENLKWSLNQLKK